MEGRQCVRTVLTVNHPYYRLRVITCMTRRTCLIPDATASVPTPVAFTCVLVLLCDRSPLLLLCVACCSISLQFVHEVFITHGIVPAFATDDGAKAYAEYVTNLRRTGDALKAKHCMTWPKSDVSTVETAPSDTKED